MGENKAAGEGSLLRGEGGGGGWGGGGGGVGISEKNGSSFQMMIYLPPPLPTPVCRSDALPHWTVSWIILQETYRLACKTATPPSQLGQLQNVDTTYQNCKHS